LNCFSPISEAVLKKEVMRKWIAAIVLILIIIIGYNYVYQNHRNIDEEKPEFSLTADTIKNEFASNGSVSQRKYLNKTVVITGQVTDSNAKEITLNSSVFCQLNMPLKSSLNNEASIKIKGRVIGYDDLLEQVKLDQCSIIN
jgi:hypothetical protein